jgi:hypothetical protein
LTGKKILGTPSVRGLAEPFGGLGEVAAVLTADSVADLGQRNSRLVRHRGDRFDKNMRAKLVMRSATKSSVVFVIAPSLRDAVPPRLKARQAIEVQEDAGDKPRYSPDVAAKVPDQGEMRAVAAQMPTHLAAVLAPQHPVGVPGAILLGVDACHNPDVT